LLRAAVSRENQEFTGCGQSARHCAAKAFPK
jgi:hypothetical protein